MHKIKKSNHLRQPKLHLFRTMTLKEKNLDKKMIHYKNNSIDRL